MFKYISKSKHYNSLVGEEIDIYDVSKIVNKGLNIIKFIRSLNQNIFDEQISLIQNFCAQIICEQNIINESLDKQIYNFLMNTRKFVKKIDTTKNDDYLKQILLISIVNYKIYELLHYTIDITYYAEIDYITELPFIIHEYFNGGIDNFEFEGDYKHLQGHFTIEQIIEDCL